MNNNCNGRVKLLRKIQKLGFTLVEANLYLDTHPNCHKALEYFKRQKAAYEKHVAEYESSFGPLTAASCNADHEWTWINGPWPWESEAN